MLRRCLRYRTADVQRWQASTAVSRRLLARILSVDVTAPADLTRGVVSCQVRDRLVGLSVRSPAVLLLMANISEMVS